MLSQVLTLLEQQSGGLGAREISRRLGLQPGALNGMLDLLVSQGRLAKVEPCDTACGACPLHNQCNLLAGRQPRYVLVRRRLGYGLAAGPSRSI